MLTYEEVSRALKYDPKTGSLTWTDVMKLGLRNKEAGSINQHGYVDISYKRHRMYGHRVAWLLTHKEWPNGKIDHINGIVSDNRIENLRIVTDQENARNRKQHSGNSSSVTGVYWNKRAKKWQSYICVNGKQKYLGIFKYLIDAERARRDAEIKYGFHGNHGRITNNQN